MVAFREMRVPISVLIFVAKISFCQVVEPDLEYPEDAFQALQDTADFGRVTRATCTIWIVLRY